METLQVAIVACKGIALGGAQVRCVETARALSARGTPTRCFADCAANTLQRLAKLSLRSIIFIRNLPANPSDLVALRAAACSLFLDTLDLSAIWHKPSCSSVQMLAPLDGVIANNRISWKRIAKDCPVLARKPVFLIEHFHSVTRRVSDGSAWGDRAPLAHHDAAGMPRPRALLVQEHRVSGRVGFCNDIRAALPKTVLFDCYPLWGGFAAPGKREGFLRNSLNLTSGDVRTIGAQHFGVGALFTAVYARYDLLLQWLPTNSSSQRLTNALASGVPVIAISCPAFDDAYGDNPEIPLARSLDQMREWAAKLAASRALRMRVSAAGVKAASRFDPNAIVTQYLGAMDRASAARASAQRNRWGGREIFGRATPEVADTTPKAQCRRKNAVA